MKKEKIYQSLILEIIKLYQSARKVAYPDKRISRGRSHSVSSIAEDLFAKFLIKNIKCDQIFIDQPITVEGLKNTPYPDLLIVKGNTIIGTCDLKMDMGWNRDGVFDLCKKSFNLAKKIRGKKCKIRSGVDKKNFEFKISSKYFHNVVIISDQNNNELKLEEQRKMSLKFKPSVNVFVLTSGKHLNTYNIESKELLKIIHINYDEFNKLIKIFS